MPTEDRALEARRRWIELYLETGNAGIVCRRCGVSRPTLRKWWRRFVELGEAGLEDRSRRPHRSIHKLTPEHVQWILTLRRKRKLGPKRIQAELLRLHQFRLSTATIWKVLAQHHVSRLQRRRRHPVPKRYNRPIPGDRVQMDTFKVGPGRYQYTAIDDCTRVRVLGLYPRRTARNSVDFLLNRVLYEFPFPVQRIQTDRGAEFFGLAFQEQLRAQAIKFRPTPPRSPHLNGKVERSQQTDWIEFYSTADLADPQLPEQLEAWQFFYNWHRPHSALNGCTPMDRWFELLDHTPLTHEVGVLYNPNTERIQERNFWVDQQLRKLKRSR